MSNENVKTAPKFVYNCVRCGQYCSKVKNVPVYLQDITRWRENGILNGLAQNIGMDMSGGFPQLVLETKEEESEHSITDITDFLSDSEEDKEEELMDVNVPHLRKVLFNRLRDKQAHHIEGLINTYNLKKKNKIKKSVLEKLLEQAIHL